MRIALLSKNPELYSTQRVLEAARQRGHDAFLVDFSRCYLTVGDENQGVFAADQPIGKVDAVVSRIGASQSFYGTAVVRQYEMADIYCVNGSLAIARARDKLRALQILARKGIELPVTGVAHAVEDVEGLLQRVGKPPYIIKLVEGTQGMGVVKADTFEAARSVVEAFRNLDADILVQEFIAEAEGADLRCFVVGEKVVAAMRRQGPPGEFRSNLHRGGMATKAKLTSDERKVAIAAARAMDLRVAGVDILRSKRGPLVMEVNSSPGLEGIEKATGIDVAGAIIEHVEKHAERGHRGDRASAH